MHLVVAGGVEDVVQGAQTGHQLGVDPELIEQVELLVDNSVAGRHKQGKGKVKGLQGKRSLTQHLLLLTQLFTHPTAECLEG